MKIVIAIDKFKDSASSVQIAQAATRAILQGRPQATVVTVPVADGGKGTVNAIAAALPNLRKIGCEVSAPLLELEPVNVKYLADDQNSTAIMELSAASGLWLVPQHLRNPMRTSTLGTGQMILDAIHRGYRHIVLGIGGSATNDGATGILAAR